jgi:hypothetical protein
LTKWQVGKMARQVDKMEVSKMASRQNGKFTKWQVGKMTSWQNGKLVKWQVDKMAN